MVIEQLQVIQLQELFYGLLNFRLKNAIVKVLSDKTYRQNALKFRQIIQNSGGAKRAVDIIESAIATNKPV